MTMLSKNIGAVFILLKGTVRLIFYMLKRPHYIAALIAILVGIFYLNGVPPREIGAVVQKKWQAFAENRKQTFKEDLMVILKRYGLQDKLAFKEAVRPATDIKKTADNSEKNIGKKTTDKAEPPENSDENISYTPEASETLKPGSFENQMQEEVFGWQQALRQAQKETEKRVKNKVIQGTLYVVGADKVRIGNHTFSLFVKLRAGKAAEAFRMLKHDFEGRNAQCVPDEDFKLADCLIGTTSLSDTLVDFGMADPI